MRVLIVTPLYPPDIGGPATHTLLLEQSLPHEGVEVCIVSFTAVRHFPKGIRHLLFLYSVWQVSKQVDIIYALDPVSVGFPACIVSFVRRKKFVMRIAGDYAWEQGTERFGVVESLEKFVKNKKHSFRLKVLEWIERWTASRAKRVIVPSQYLKGILREWGIPEANIAVVHNSVESNCDTGNRRTLRAMLKVKGEIIMSAGRLIPLKNFKDLILVVQKLKKDFPALKLLIAGEGPDRKNLEALIKEHNLDGTVVLTGRLDRDVLFRYISISDVFVLNSWHETFSHLLLEVMAIGTPVVATNVGGTPEIITHNKEGLLIPSKNKESLEMALKTMLTDSAKAQAFARAAKKRAQTFSPERELRGITTVLKSV